MPYNSQADVVHLLAEWYDTKSNIKSWTGFDPSFKRPRCLAALKSCDTTKQSVCGWQYIYIYIYTAYIYHYHQIILIAWIVLTLSYHLSLLVITLSRSSRLQLVSEQSWWMEVFAGHLRLASLCVGVHRKMLLMNSSLLLQQCASCLVHLTWMVCEMEGK